MLRAGIIGGGGYTAGELIRVLLYHPEVEIDFVFSQSQNGNLVSDVHDDLVGECFMHFTDKVSFEVDVLFLCMGHGRSREFMERHAVPSNVAVIDLSSDFRLDASFVYGLPELFKPQIQQSNRIANCGCFATAIQLALLPLAKEGLLQNEVHVHAITGSTGAGQSPQSTSHFSWRNNNLSIYKAFTHQHLDEINQSLHYLQPGFNKAINFIPVRGDFARGIFASAYVDCPLSEEAVYTLYEDYYQAAPFTQLSHRNPNLKQVVNTNKCLLYLEKHGDKILIISVIDNLLKGASGQAVQNMNLIFGKPESMGLHLKSVVY
ncbi:MAG: N-acetyl-gamma-glutamyl-phosphate reductase [Saprospiraceae bacterium]